MIEEIIEEYGNIYDYIKQEFFLNNKYTEALEFIEKEGNPADIEFWGLLAQIHFVMGNQNYGEGNFGLALDHFYEITKIMPYWAVVYNSIGLTYLKLEDYENAVENFNKSIELSGNTYAHAFYNLGYLYFKQGDTEKAYEYRNKACELEPENDYSEYNII